MSRASDLTGRVVGRLTVLRRALSDGGGNSQWLCRCSCGTEKEIRGTALQNGTTKSCGCLQREATTRANYRRLPTMLSGTAGGIDPEFDL